MRRRSGGSVLFQRQRMLLKLWPPLLNPLQ